ncbi:hypothetical protein FKW77_003975 [Venturia effusa]|uniref:FAD dependent oxidoreductase domain-containing protein n=1 Tax=Venturia effusa TaxID=50376 RepID=A0A517L555_9PEZI|nr:hypothetical protein FKW77_003975 [Venturia effusa]
MKYLIVGAGAFGASLALYLKKAHPDVEIDLIDCTPFPNPSAAAHDLNKIIRAEYEDPMYMSLALEAIDIWRNDPIYKPYFHEIGIIFAGILEPGLKVVENYKKLTGKSPAKLLEPDEAKPKFDGIWRDADWTGAAIDLGMKYAVHTVTGVVFDESGATTGVKTAENEVLLANRVVLCTGARTAELLADSAPEKPELYTGDRLVAAAAAICLFRVPESEMSKFTTIPAIVNPMGEIAGESIPPGPKRLCKCTHELSFKNDTFHEASKTTISIPPKAASQKVWSQALPVGLKEETHKIAKKMYGSYVEGLEPETYRMCWDAITPNQDFVICPHPASNNLFIAAGGSFHGWKFLANIGIYITQMLDGELSEEKKARWAWDRSNEGGNCAMYLPQRDLKDIKGYAKM